MLPCILSNKSVWYPECVTNDIRKTYIGLKELELSFNGKASAFFV
jgi:hypothetical protein